jgi:hypothetical protein
MFRQEQRGAKSSRRCVGATTPSFRTQRHRLRAMLRREEQKRGYTCLPLLRGQARHVLADLARFGGHVLDVASPSLPARSSGARVPLAFIIIRAAGVIPNSPRVHELRLSEVGKQASHHRS